ncbi:sigma 54-interacting transcriptional regulator [Pseudoflavonifractor hominis]
MAVSPAMQHKVEMAKKFSQAPSNVLITGETGTGKELFAHSIHAASSRAGQPFVAVNCATLPETLLESELFGYEPGAFSGASREGKTGLFELAHHGTIFLDEIGEIPVTLQAKLLRERPDDILPLVESQIRVLAAEQGKSPPLLTPQARDLLRRYAWPGNVRELRNVCERLVVLSSAQAVDEEALRDLHLFFPERESPRTVEVERPMQEPITFQIPVTMKKKDLAKELGISRTTLWRMTKRQEALRKQQEEKTP